MYDIPYTLYYTQKLNIKFDARSLTDAEMIERCQFADPAT